MEANENQVTTEELAWRNINSGLADMAMSAEAADGAFGQIGIVRSSDTFQKGYEEVGANNLELNMRIGTRYSANRVARRPGEYVTDREIMADASAIVKRSLSRLTLAQYAELTGVENIRADLDRNAHLDALPENERIEVYTASFDRLRGKYLRGLSDDVTNDATDRANKVLAPQPDNSDDENQE